MTLALAILAVLEAVVIVLLYRSRNKAWRENARHAKAYFWHRVEHDHEIADLREMVNRTRRNTGKAEM